MKKTLVCILIAAMLVSGCAPREPAGESIVPSAPESSASAAEQSLPAESVPEESAPEEPLALFRQLELLDRAGRPLTRREMSDALLALEEAGYVVYGDHYPLAGYQRAYEFFSGEEDGFLDIYQLYPTNLYGIRYARKGGEWEFSFIECAPEGIRVGEPAPAEVRYTELGNLIMHVGEPGSEYHRGIRITPLPDACYDAYWKYVAPVDAVTALRDSWGAPDYESLNLDYAFELLYGHENGVYIGASEYYNQERDCAVVPPEIVEDILPRYFELTPDALRSRVYGKYEDRMYDPEEQAYLIQSFRGGGYWGVTEVWEIIENPDGSISLTLAQTALDFADEGSPSSVLTVMPREDGSFRYIRHTVNEAVFAEAPTGEGARLMSRGEQIGDWTLDRLGINYSENGEIFKLAADFSGEVTLRGQLARSDVFEDSYDFIVAREDWGKLPHYISPGDSAREQIVFLPEMTEELRAAQPELAPGEAIPCEITISDYRYVYAPMMAPTLATVIGIEPGAAQ